MYILDPVIDLLESLFEPIKNEILKAILQILFSFVLIAIYIVAFCNIADGISFIIANRYIVIVLDLLTMVAVAVVLYLILLGISKILKK